MEQNKKGEDELDGRGGFGDVIGRDEKDSLSPYIQPFLPPGRGWGEVGDQWPPENTKRARPTTIHLFFRNINPTAVPHLRLLLPLSHFCLY